ncbi:MAG: phosphoribosylglycinamide formyltransferase [Bacteroides sp.]|nr:phosphoribosylglycinamide formyltransferase [Bacteroides sp.]
MAKNIAIFASGSGTNAENIIRYFRVKGGAQVVLVVTNRKDAYVAERARRLQVPCVYQPKEEWAEGNNVLALLEEKSVDFIVLAGFLARIPDRLLRAYPDRIVNIHPSLLPKFGGKGMYGNRVHEAVLAAGEAESGITIHYINEHYDEGTVIAQYRCPVLPTDTAEELAQRVHSLEYEYYPKEIEVLMKNDE